jgi:hypothetical protein
MTGDLLAAGLLEAAHRVADLEAEIERLRPLARLGEAVEAMPIGAMLDHCGQEGNWFSAEWSCVWPHPRGHYNLMNRQFGKTPEEAMQNAAKTPEELRP